MPDNNTVPETRTAFARFLVTNKRSAFFGEEFDGSYFPTGAGYREGNRSIHTEAKTINGVDYPEMSFSDKDLTVKEIYYYPNAVDPTAKVSVNATESAFV